MTDYHRRNQISDDCSRHARRSDRGGVRSIPETGPLVELIKNNPEKWNHHVTSVIYSVEHPPVRNKTLFNLRGADLSGLDLTGVLFRYCDLTGANLSNSRFFETKFMGCDLRNADLRGAKLTMTSFVNARLNGVDLRGAAGRLNILQSVDMVDALMDDEGRGLLPESYLYRREALKDASPSLRHKLRFEMGRCTLKPHKEVEAVIKYRGDRGEKTTGLPPVKKVGIFITTNKQEA